MTDTALGTVLLLTAIEPYYTPSNFQLLHMQAMCRDYYTLDFMDRSVDTSPIAPALAAFFDDVLDRSVSQLNFKVLQPQHDVLCIHLMSAF